MADCQTEFDMLALHGMNCAERLVEIFGTQAEVARALPARPRRRAQLGEDRATCRRAGRCEVERVTDGQHQRGRHPQRSQRQQAGPREVAPGRREPFRTCPTGSDPMNQYAPAKRISSFHPPQRTLMGPGPTEIHPRVLTTMSQPAIGYLDPVFVEMMEELKSLLRYAYQTKNALTFPISGPGLGRHGVLLRQHGGAGRQGRRLPNGVFGGRMIENVERCGGTPVRGRGRVGRAGRSAEARRRAEEEHATRRSSPSCTPRPRPACSRTPRRSSRSRTSTAR